MEHRTAAGETNAQIFLDEIKKLRLTGREFLAIIGNTKISNEAYTEIRDNPQLTYQRLVEILETSPLGAGDYEKILTAAQQRAAQKQLEKRQTSETKLSTAMEEAERRLENKRRLELERKRREALLFDRRSEMKTTAPENPPAEELTEEFTDGQELSYTNEIEYDPAAYGEEDDTDDEYDSYTDDGRNRNNTGYKITSAVLAVVLTLFSFGLRYAMTGSLLIDKEPEVVFTMPEDYSGLAALLCAMSEESGAFEALGGGYYLAGETSPALTDAALQYEHMLFNISEGNFQAVDLSGGSARVLHHEALRPGFIGMLVQDGLLYMLYEGEYAASYRCADPVGLPAPEEGEIAPVVSGEFTQQTVEIEVYHAAEYSPVPVMSFTQDGSFTGLHTEGGELYITTSYSVKNPHAQSDLGAYIPSYSLGGMRSFVAFDHIFLPQPLPENSRMTVISRISGSTLLGVYSCIGGLGGDITFAGESLYAVQQNAATSTVMRFTPEMSGLMLENTVQLPGTVYLDSVDERDGIVRIGTYDGESSGLFIYNEALEPLAEVSGIGGGEELLNVFFDAQYAYFIANSLYVMDTSVPDDPLFASEALVYFYSDDFYRWNDRDKLSIEAAGQSGIMLSMFRAEKGSMVEQHSTVISAENVIEGWDAAISTPAELDESAVCMIPELGLIVIPVKYFNGVTELEKFIVLDYTEAGGFTKRGELVEFDSDSGVLRSFYYDGYIHTYWSGKEMFISADSAEVRVASRSYLDGEAVPEAQENPPQTEEAGSGDFE